MPPTTPPDSDTRRPRRPAAQTREHLLAVAGELFYRYGIRATGVDAVAARAGVAPPTLYRLFSTKDDLVAAYVQRCSTAYQQRLTTASDAATGTPHERLLAVFDVFADDALTDTCRGCPFLLVLAEYPDPESPPHRQAVAHKTWVRDLLHRLVGDLNHQTPVNDPARLADHLTLVAEGIYGAVQAHGANGPAQFGRDCANALVRGACAAHT